MNVELKEKQNNCIKYLKSTKQKTNQFKTPLLKVSKQRKLEKPKYMQSTNSPHNPPPKTPPTTQKKHTLNIPTLKEIQAQKNKPPETSILAKETTKNM